MIPAAFDLRVILSAIVLGALLCLGWRLGDWAVGWPATPRSGLAALLIIVLLLLLIFGL